MDSQVVLCEAIPKSRGRRIFPTGLLSFLSIRFHRSQTYRVPLLFIPGLPVLSAAGRHHPRGGRGRTRPGPRSLSKALPPGFRA